MFITKPKLIRWQELVFFEISLRRFRISFSSNFDMIGNSAIGGYDPTSVWFITGFGNMITFDTFQDPGTHFSQIEALIIVVSFTNPSL
jgi:hypothetical protein